MSAGLLLAQARPHDVMHLSGSYTVKAAEQVQLTEMSVHAWCYFGGTIHVRVHNMYM